MEEAGKESTSVRKYTERAKPAIVEVNGKSVLAGGRWNDTVVADFLLDQDDWVKVGELARFACGSNTIPNKKRVRSKLSSLFMELRRRGYFLAVEYSDGFNAASAVKIADLNSANDRQNVLGKLDRMKKRKELSETQYAQSIALLHQKLSC